MLVGYLLFLFMGITLGIFGGGGAIITLPILVYFFGVSATHATLYSLFIVGIASLLAGGAYIKKEGIAVKSILAFLVPSFVGVFLARKVLLPLIPDQWEMVGRVIERDSFLLILFSVIMILAATKMLRKAPEVREQKSKTALVKIIISGAGVGFLAGLLGAGGGFLIVPALVLWVGFEVRKAIGHSLVIIALQSLFGFLLGGVAGQVMDWNLLVAASIVSVIGIALGVYLGAFLSSQKLKSYFAYFIMIMGIALGGHQIWGLVAQ